MKNEESPQKVGEEKTNSNKDNNKDKKLTLTELRDLTGDDVVFAGFISYNNLQKIYETHPERVVFSQKDFEKKLEEFQTQKITL